MQKLKNIFLPNKRNNYRPHITRLPVIAILALSVLGLQGIYNYQQVGAVKVLGYATNVNSSGLLVASNQQRANNGLSALTLNSQLSVAAQNKANHMVANNYWAHVAPDGTTPWYFISNAGYQYQSAAENLAYGFSTSSGVLTGWMNSPTHRANVLGGFTHVGFGIANGASFQGGPNTVVVAMYGTPVGGTQPKPQTDYCNNISGVQAAVPSGYYRSSGSCYKQQTDYCNNINGVQAAVPGGYYRSNGSCYKNASPTPAPVPTPAPQNTTPAQQAETPSETSAQNEGESEIKEEESDLEENEEEQEEAEQITSTALPWDDPNNNPFRLTNNEQITNNDFDPTPWPSIVAIVTLLAVVIPFAFRHLVYFHNLLVDGKRLIQNHPLIEMTAVYVPSVVLLSVLTG